MVEGGGLMMDDVRGICFVLPSRQSLGVGTLIPRDFILDPGTSSRVTYAPLVASSRRSCQTTVVLFNTETQRNRRVFSQGLSVPLVVIPPGFFLGHPRSASGVFQTLLSNSGGSLQHRVAEESEIILSGFSVPLVVIP